MASLDIMDGSAVIRSVDPGETVIIHDRDREMTVVANSSTLNWFRWRKPEVLPQYGEVCVVIPKGTEQIRFCRWNDSCWFGENGEGEFVFMPEDVYAWSMIPWPKGFDFSG